MFLYILCIILILLLIYIIYLNSENYKEEKYTAIIIEPREHTALYFVLNNFVENLSKKWNFIIFHGNKNINYINNILKTPLLSKNIHRIKLINLNVDNLTIENYNKLLVSKDFYNNIPTEIFLIFQTDSMICKEYNYIINDFIKYDYVGAPLKSKLVGNGGLSLRRKSKMLEILNDCDYKNEPEDVYFSVACNKINVNKPSYEKAKKFSVEAVYNQTSFGVHKPWIFLNKYQMIDKNNYCNGVLNLRELNK